MNQYGVDVALQRADDLDKLLLRSIRDMENCTVLELGCGGGGQSVRMADAGATVFAVDIVDYSKLFEEVLNVDFKQVDIKDLCVPDGQRFTYCLFQRAIHYLRYSEALELLKYVKTIIDERLFVSVTGIESDIGHMYVGSKLPVTQRYEMLDSEAQKTFSIFEPVCLYSPEEFIELLTSAGWEVEECWISAFGNIKAVCR